MGGAYATIRSESGKYCQPNAQEGKGWGAYLARKICWQQEDPLTKKKFSETECGDKIKNTTENTLETKADKNVSAAELCIFLQKFVSLDACKSGQLKYPEPVCPDMPRYLATLEKDISNERMISLLLHSLYLGYYRGSDAVEILGEFYAFKFDARLNEKTYHSMGEIIDNKYVISSVLFTDIKFADEKCHYTIVAYVANPNKPKYEMPLILKVRKRTKYKI